MALVYLNNIDSVLIHIPKCGGMSIRFGVLNFDDENQIHPEGTISYRGMTKEWEDKFKFAFVRNPYDRIVSAWRMLKLGTCRGHPRNVFDDFDVKYVDKFSEFVKYATDESIGYDPESDFLQFLRHHCLPMTDPYFFLSSANFVGRFETFKPDLKKIFDKFNKPYKPNHINKSHHKHYSKYYTDSIFELVTEVFKKDLKTYNYEFKTK